jgi:hypothetical protein
VSPYTYTGSLAGVLYCSHLMGGCPAPGNVCGRRLVATGSYDSMASEAVVKLGRSVDPSVGRIAGGCVTAMMNGSRLSPAPLQVYTSLPRQIGTRWVVMEKLCCCGWSWSMCIMATITRGMSMHVVTVSLELCGVFGAVHMVLRGAVLRWVQCSVLSAYCWCCDGTDAQENLSPFVISDLL